MMESTDSYVRGYIEEMASIDKRVGAWEKRAVAYVEGCGVEYTRSDKYARIIFNDYWKGVIDAKADKERALYVAMSAEKGKMYTKGYMDGNNDPEFIPLRKNEIASDPEYKAGYEAGRAAFEKGVDETIKQVAARDYFRDRRN